jgi:two-component system, NarL family, response regulator DevR
VDERAEPTRVAAPAPTAPPDEGARGTDLGRPMYARPHRGGSQVTRWDLDGVQQRLYAVLLRVGDLRARIADAEADTGLGRLETELGEVIREVRHLATQLPAEARDDAARDRQPPAQDASSDDLAPPPTIVVVDDHAVVRAGIRSSLDQAPCRCRVVGEAGTAADALELVERERPDVALLDVVLPDGDGIQLCREIRSRYPATACIVLTSFPDPRGRLSAALAGAAAYLAKDGDATDLVATVREVTGGGRQLEPDRIADLLEAVAGAPEDDARVAQLTDQERRVFELIGQGLSNRQIAHRLHLAEHTVKNYSSRMLGKLAMERRSEAAVLSARLAERRAQTVARGLGRPR